MTKILGISSKKTGGKTTTFNYLLGMEMLRLGIVRDKFFIDDKGDLHISDIFGDKSFEGIFDPQRRNTGMRTFLQENVSPFIKYYSFAEKLKEMCVDLLELKEEQCFGTDEQKNSLTHLKWEDMPGYNNSGLPHGKSGFMTGREVMEYVGTDVMRKIFDPIWINSTIRQIEKDGSMLAVICDCRFPNEVGAIHKAGGKVIRLTRDPFPDSTHPAEVSLNKDKFDWEQFDAIIDNANMSVDEKNVAVQLQLEKWGYVDKLEFNS